MIFLLSLPSSWGLGVCGYTFKHLQLPEDRTVLLVDRVRGLGAFLGPPTPSSWSVPPLFGFTGEHKQNTAGGGLTVPELWLPEEPSVLPKGSCHQLHR